MLFTVLGRNVARIFYGDTVMKHFLLLGVCLMLTMLTCSNVWRAIASGPDRPRARELLPLAVRDK